jgi:hemolysin D
MTSARKIIKFPSFPKLLVPKLPVPKLSDRHREFELAFLPAALEVLETPPSPVGRSISVTIVAVFCLAVAWAIYAHVDIVASAQGKIVPSGRSKMIQSLEIGVVRAINVQDGQEVKAGDVLIELDPTINAAERDRLQSDLTGQQLDIARLRAALADNDDPLAEFHPPPSASESQVNMHAQYLVSQTAEQRAKVAGLDRQQAQKQADRAVIDATVEKLAAIVPPLQERVDVRKYLFGKELGSKLLYLQEYQELVGQEHDLIIQKKRLAEADAGIEAVIEQRAQAIAEYRSKLFADLSTAEQKAAALGQELIKADEKTRLQRLTAPVDGIVQQLSVHTIGGIIRPAEQLLMVVPVDSGLEIEAMVPNRDIGFVHAGQDAEVKVDTFNFTRYGLLHGHVLSVSHDSIPRTTPERPGDATVGSEAATSEPKGQELTFSARIGLENSEMMIDNGVVRLTPGMAVTVEIKTGTRRVIGYLLSPVMKYRHESLQER